MSTPHLPLPCRPMERNQPSWSFHRDRGSEKSGTDIRTSTQVFQFRSPEVWWDCVFPRWSRWLVWRWWAGDTTKRRHSRTETRSKKRGKRRKGPETETVSQKPVSLASRTGWTGKADGSFQALSKLGLSRSDGTVKVAGSLVTGPITTQR